MDFLGEARGRLGRLVPDLFIQVINHYQQVADRLGDLSQSYPFIAENGPQIIPIDDQCQEAICWLKEARQVEKKVLTVLE